MSQASRGAALSYIAQAVPRVTQDVIGKVQAGRDRKEDMKDKELERKLSQGRLDAMGRQATIDEQNIDTGDRKAEQRKKASDLNTKIQADIFAEEIKVNKKKALDTELGKMSKEKLQVEYGADNLAQAKELAYTEIDLPTGATKEDIVKKYRNEIEALQFTDPTMQGRMAGITQRTKRAEKKEDIEGEKLFSQGEGAVDYARSVESREDKQEFESSQLNKRLSAQERMKKITSGEADAETSDIPDLKPISNIAITKDSVKRVKEAYPMIKGVSNEINGLKDLYNKVGIELVGADAARLKSKVRKIQLQLKSKAFLDLGVLNGPDLDLLEEVVPDPSTLKAGAKKAAFGKVFEGQLGELLDFVDSRGEMFYRANGFEADNKGVTGQAFNSTPVQSGMSDDDFNAAWGE